MFFKYLQQERCSKNKASRAKQKTVHTAGRKSFARVQKEMRKENKVEPTRHEVFIRTHTRKNGQPLDEYSKELIGMIREIEENYPEVAKREIGPDDLFASITDKKDTHGHVRCLGLGPSPSDVWGEKPTKTEYIKENRVLKKQVNEMTQKYEDLQAQLVAMKDEMEEIKNQNKSKGKKKHKKKKEKSHEICPEEVRQDEQKSSHSTHEILTKGHTSKKRKIHHSDSDEEHAIQSHQHEVQSCRIRSCWNILKT